MSGNGPGSPGALPGGNGDDENPNDPLAALLRALSGGGAGLPGGELPPELARMMAGAGLPADPAALQAMVAQVQRMMTAGGGDGPVNWELARDVARQAAAAGGDPVVGDAAQRQVAEALRTADLWLDRVTDVPATTARTHAWSRAEWVEATLPVWKGVVEPIADSVGTALQSAMSSQLPAEMAPMLAGALPMVRQMGGAFFGAQMGSALGALAGEVLGGGDVGLPLLPPGRAALLPSNVDAFGEGLGLPADEVRLYVALREAAHARLFSASGWLRPHLMGAVEEYARGITIDTDALEEAVRQVDPTNVEALQEALSSGMFEPARTPAQQAALDRLETALALVEGWVDEVVDAAARANLPHAAALRETVRRRRAAGGPAEHTFASLVGLELRPRRLREAAAVWAALTRTRGATGRDALWEHPDLLPTAAAFADPDAFAAAGHGEDDGSDLDAALAAILDDADALGGPAPGDGATGDAPDGTDEDGGGSRT